MPGVQKIKRLSASSTMEATFLRDFSRLFYLQKHFKRYTERATTSSSVHNVKSSD